MSRPSDLKALSRAAARLAASAATRNARLPPLLVLTDPVRTPDPVALAERLPPGVGLVYRAFGASDAEVVAQRLAAVGRRRDLMLLIGADPSLALACGADGVHLPERLLAQARMLRARWPRAVITGAAHDTLALRRAVALGLDAALVSTVFLSRSRSAGVPIGPLRLAERVRRGARVAIYALGGVDSQSLPRLGGTGVAGVALVGAAADEINVRRPAAPRRQGRSR